MNKNQLTGLRELLVMDFIANHGGWPVREPWKSILKHELNVNTYTKIEWWPLRVYRVIEIDGLEYAKQDYEETVG